MKTENMGAVRGARAEGPFGDGVKCVGGQTFFFPSITLDASGGADFQVDFSTSPGDQIQPGSVWNFQCFYRDPAAQGSGFNYSDALSVRFEP